MITVSFVSSCSCIYWFPLCSFLQKKNGIYILKDCLNQEFLIMVGETTIILRSGSFANTIIAFLGIHYVYDMDYEDWCEVGMLILQFIIFKDKSVPKETLQLVDVAFSSYEKFVTGKWYYYLYKLYSIWTTLFGLKFANFKSLENNLFPLTLSLLIVWWKTGDFVLNREETTLKSWQYISKWKG